MPDDQSPESTEKTKKPPIEHFLTKRLFEDPLAFVTTPAPPLKELVKTALIAFDTSALVTLYKVSQESIADIAKILRPFVTEKRLFIPKQVLREFARTLASGTSRFRTITPIRHPVAGGFLEPAQALSDC